MAKRSLKPTPVGTFLQLKVTLGGSRPPIWRRLLVPADIALSKLHQVLQISMGWGECHLHCFRHAHMTYESRANREMGGGLFERENGDEAKVRLVNLLQAVGDRLVYEYDFGDSWEHDVRVEKIVPVGPSGARMAMCLDGARACPPEDCGGLPGYEHLLRVMANPKDREHAEMIDWLGERFDPEAFDATRIDAALRTLKL